MNGNQFSWNMLNKNAAIKENAALSNIINVYS